MASDIGLIWGADLVITATGDIGTVSGGEKVLERVIRRFLTNAQVLSSTGLVVLLPDYIFHPTYGGNARQYVDSVYDQVSAQTTAAIQQSFANQAAQESGVAASPSTQITITELTDGIQLNATIVLADGTVVTASGVNIT